MCVTKFNVNNKSVVGNFNAGFNSNNVEVVFDNSDVINVILDNSGEFDIKLEEVIKLKEDY